MLGFGNIQIGRGNSISVVEPAPGVTLALPPPFPVAALAPARGKWIVLEGGDGTGKTTQCSMLVAALRAEGKTVWQTKAPGGTPMGVEIRKLLANGVGRYLGPLEEDCLHVADLCLLRAEIEMRLARGEWVVSDRSHFSSFAYSTWGKQNDFEWEVLFRSAMAGLEPDLVIWLDVDVAEGRRRAAVARGKTEDAITAYDEAGLEFYTRIRQAYEWFYQTLDFWVRVDTNGRSIEEVADEVLAYVDAYFDPDPLTH